MRLRIEVLWSGGDPSPQWLPNTHLLDGKQPAGVKGWGPGSDPSKGQEWKLPEPRKEKRKLPNQDKLPCFVFFVHILILQLFLVCLSLIKKSRSKSRTYHFRNRRSVQRSNTEQHNKTTVLDHHSSNEKHVKLINFLWQDNNMLHSWFNTIFYLVTTEQLLNAIAVDCLALKFMIIIGFASTPDGVQGLDWMLVVPLIFSVMHSCHQK